jgi:DNA-binding transcriptional regulator YhcF (GntR family)
LRVPTIPGKPRGVKRLKRHSNALYSVIRFMMRCNLYDKRANTCRKVDTNQGQDYNSPTDNPSIQQTVLGQFPCELERILMSRLKKQSAAMISEGSHSATSGETKYTAAGIARMFEAQISSGRYQVGAQLPTVRDLAEQLSVNKNTVVRAYQALEQQGYLELVRGRGAFVRQVDTPTSSEHWRHRVAQLVAEAKQLSLSRQSVMRELLQSVEMVYGRSELRIAFVECNQPDIETLGEELSAEVAYRLEGVLLSDLLKDPQSYLARFNLIVTTFFHLGEVRQALGETAHQKVVGVYVAPNHDAMLEIAKLHVPVLGLICDWPKTIDSLNYSIRAYHPSATVLPALVDDEARLHQLLNKADALVVTRSAQARLMEFRPQLPIITVTFTIDQQSIDYLRGRIEEQLARHNSQSD